MTIFEKLKTMSIDELAHFLSNCNIEDGTPWSEWFNSEYCLLCAPVMKYSAFHNKNMEYGYCEIYEKCCKLDNCDCSSGLPIETIIKLWLQSEAE